MTFFWHLFFSIVLIYVQILLMPYFSLFSATPNILIAYLIFNSQNIDLPWSILSAFITGLGLDLCYPELFGLNSFIAIIITFIINKFYNNINRAKFYSVASGIIILNLIFYLFYFIYNILHRSSVIEYHIFFVWIIIYNTFFNIGTVYLIAFINKLNISLDD